MTAVDVPNGFVEVTRNKTSGAGYVLNFLTREYEPRSISAPLRLHGGRGKARSPLHMILSVSFS